MTKEVHKGKEYDAFLDAIYPCPECPHCRTPMLEIGLSDIGKTVKCPYCDSKVYVSDSEWLREYFSGNVENKEETMECMSCGGEMKLFMTKRNGAWRTLLGRCEKCGMRINV